MFVRLLPPKPLTLAWVNVAMRFSNMRDAYISQKVRKITYNKTLVHSEGAGVPKTYAIKWNEWAGENLLEIEEQMKKARQVNLVPETSKSGITISLCPMPQAGARKKFQGGNPGLLSSNRKHYSDGWTQEEVNGGFYDESEKLVGESATQIVERVP